MNESPENEYLLERIDELRVSIETLQERLATERAKTQRAVEAARAYRSLFFASTFDEVTVNNTEATYAAFLTEDGEHHA